MKWTRRLRYINAKAKLIILVAGICLLLLILFLLPSGKVNQNKATWLWDASLIRSETEEIVAFSGREGITTIFLQIQKEVTEEEYRRFVAAAHQKGISVHALGGQPDWAYGEGQGQGMELLTWLDEYNQASAPEEKFEGVQFDVEPYVLRRWDREQVQVVEEWSANMKVWVQEAERQNLPLSAAVPFWLDSIPGPKGENSDSFSRWMIQNTDAIAVMAYRDSGEQMYELSKEELKQADELGKSVWIGMELGDTEEGEHLTFFTKSEQEMEDEALSAAKLGSDHSSFAGLAVHHYQAWVHKRTAMVEEKR
ncbi:hypothetical protein AWU65_19395 [Paenibacillus glucanolyticus]|uniref:Amidase n=1 Tax=Paenibacillus glucanolyticus TaxID=59843 RepID=A0A163L9U2_9BACL|nr:MULTISPECIES: hypothetical protein [Paenibacillus]AWP28560.1 hypothetical protein B9D94_18880 [Paenibacillus sp. Cedars]KZS47928.1 hypothetical protein AWU65_19395 [Paenibacillus glucanolyticus]MDH6671704.1 hypothetical protein [Paenibacillus sp. LBL]OMF70799.1 hypothetical protein BK142_23045 [Paenibacillus glucanolyticus]